IQGDFPFPQETELSFLAMVKKTDFVLLCQQNPPSGSHIVRIASALLSSRDNIAEAAKQHLENQLLACLDTIVRHYADKTNHATPLIANSSQPELVSGHEDAAIVSHEQISEKADVLTNFFEAVRHLAHIAGHQDQSAERFAQLISPICSQHAPALAPFLRPILQNLVEKLPPTIGHHLWHPLMMLRAV
uniref:hypothetical protein n=1 Tax=Candidatus Magnetaquicoccus inordinatus TaxID=2496818 RepID=UPI00187D5C36